MEILWDDFYRNASKLESPAWHGNILQQREEQLKQGKNSFEDWEQVKKEIRKNIT
jgi:hypothetical protein